MDIVRTIATNLLDKLTNRSSPAPFYPKGRRNSREGRRNHGTVVDYLLDRRSITAATFTRLL